MARNRPLRILVALASSRTSNRSFLQGVARYAQRHADWQVTFVDTHGLDGPALDRTLAQLDGRIDGVLVKENTEPTLRRRFAGRCPPFAVFGSPPVDGPQPDTTYFAIDGVEIGALAARHFRALGNFASYGFYAGEEDQSFVRHRAEGYRRELKRLGIAPSCSYSYGDPEETRRWLATLQRPAAVFCACDVYAIRLLDLCRDDGVPVPLQVSVLGADDDQTLGLFARPTLSSLQLPHERLGEEAAAALARRLQRGRPVGPRCVELAGGTVVERDSTATPVPAAHLIRHAVAFIQQNPAVPLGVEDVARHVGVSRKLLERRFREMGETPIKEQIIRTRLAHLQRQLLLSDKPLHVVAASCGFANPVWIKTLFRSRFGLTMTAFRRQARA